MTRIINLLLLLLMIGGAAVTYDMKHKAEDASRRVARLNANIAKEKEAIAVLKAEWSVLSQPSRLQAVITKYPEHFNLEPFSANQMATLADLPEKPIEGVPISGETSVADAAAAIQ